MGARKIINKKEILIFTILSVMNFLFCENPVIGSVIAVIEIIFVLNYLLITRSTKKTFYWHILFLLTSLEVSTNSAGYVGMIYGYKHFELPFLPVAVSTLITIFLLVVHIIKNKKIKYKKNDLVYKMIILFFILPLTTGIIGLLLRDYDIGFFINSAMQPFICLCVYILLYEHRNVEDIEKLKSLLISALFGSVLSSYISKFLGVQASYGAHSTFPANQILWFSPFLIFLSLYYKGRQKAFILLIGIMACVNLLLFNSTGKAILFVIVALFVYMYKNITNLRRIVSSLFIIIFVVLMSLAMSDYFVNVAGSNILLKAKFNQIVRLSSITNWGYRLENIPPSPRVRIAETINIYFSLKENVIDLFIGRGFGGYFEDSSHLFSDLSLYGLDLTQGSFSEKQVLMGKYVSPHESLNEIFLLAGFLGIFIWIRVVINLFIGVFRDNRNSFYKLIAFLFIALMWNTYVILSYFGLIIVYVSQYGERNSI